MSQIANFSNNEQGLILSLLLWGPSKPSGGGYLLNPLERISSKSFCGCLPNSLEHGCLRNTLGVFFKQSGGGCLQVGALPSILRLADEIKLVNI